MNSRRYWKNRLPFLLTNLVCMAALTVFLLVCGNSVSAVVLILIVWALILLTGLVLTYWKRKRQMKKLLDMAEQLSERYLISEVMELPEQAEDQVYYQLLKMAGKSMLEQIGEVERERLEYKEYIEQWIHEIKTPITAMKLLYRLWGNYCVYRTKQHSDKGRFDFFGISSPKKRLSPAGKVRFSSLGNCTEGL